MSSSAFEIQCVFRCWDHSHFMLDGSFPSSMGDDLLLSLNTFSVWRHDLLPEERHRSHFHGECSRDFPSQRPVGWKSSGYSAFAQPLSWGIDRVNVMDDTDFAHSGGIGAVPRSNDEPRPRSGE